MYIQIVLKGKHALCGDRSGLTCQIRRTICGCEKKIRDFLYYEFKTMNSFSQIQNELVTSFFMNFYEFIHTNFVSAWKTSNLFIRICEGFQHVMLRMACTVIELEI